MSGRYLSHTVLAAVAALLLAVSSPPGARAAIPGGDDPKAYTQHDLLRARLDFNRRTLVGAYKEVGVRNAKWDDEAVKFLDAMATYFTYPPAEPIYQTVPIPTFDEYVKLGQAAADAGCTDPLVQYCRGAVLLDRGDPADRNDAARLVERSVRPLKVRKYPAYRVRSAIARVHAVWKSYLSYEPSNWEAVLATADMPDADVRHALLAIEPFYNELPRARQLELCKALSERPTGDQQEQSSGRQKHHLLSGYRPDCDCATSSAQPRIFVCRGLCCRRTLACAPSACSVGADLEDAH